MPFDYEVHSMLNGIGASSSWGTKRTAEATATPLPYAGMADETVWKRSAPTPISTSSTQRPKPRNNVGNPYSGFASGGRTSAKPNGSNPTAAMTVTDIDSRPHKRRKTNGTFLSGLGGGVSRNNMLHEDSVKEGSSKYFVSRAVPSTVRMDTRGTRTDAGLSRLDYTQQSARRKAVAPFLSDQRTPSAEVIHIDESESEFDKDLGTVIPRPLSIPENNDEIDLIGQPTERTPARELPLKSRPLKKRSIAKDLGVPEPDTNHPFLRSSAPTRRGRSASPTRTRRIAEDGASTKRLEEKLRGHVPQEPITLDNDRWSSPLTPLSSLRGDPDTRFEEVEEIEDADTFPSLPVASSSKNNAATRTQNRLSQFAYTPNAKVDTKGKVKQIALDYEQKAKANKPRFIGDLRQVLPRKSIVGSMKKKDLSTPPLKPLEPEKVSNGRTLRSSRDSLATAQTPYSQMLALPLRVCVWGSWRRVLGEDEDELEPDYWLCLNEDADELQVYKHPLPDKKALKRTRSIQNIKLSVLRSCELTLCDDPECYLINFRFGESSARYISDDLTKTGLVFSFLNRHANMRDWGTLHTRLKALVQESGQKPCIVTRKGALACLELALRSYDDPKPTTRKSPEETTECVDTSPSIGAVEKGSVDPSKRKPQPRPRPRPVKKTHQNLRDIFAEGLTRRSARLSAEHSKEDETRQDEPELPPANLEEIVLVYPPSGQGAVNVTIGDLRRLGPSEFLNDTLIELGLKFWLNDLRARSPKLAENIHVFSSFFFKKLASKNNKTPEDGHKSVRKWTAKVDIFKKKYIIVPINENLHWYLAIIYHPEHILEPALPKAPLRTSRRIGNTAAPTNSGNLQQIPPESTDKADTDGGRPPEDDAVPAAITTSNNVGNDADEDEVERELSGEVELGVTKSLRSCSLDEQQFSSIMYADSSKDEMSTSLQYPENESTSTPASVDGVEDYKPDLRAENSYGDDISMEASEDGAVSKDPSTVDDSLSEESDDAEVDELDEDDTPMSQGPSHIMETMPLPGTNVSERVDPALDDDETSRMEVDNAQREDSKSLPSFEPSDNDMSDQEDRPRQEADKELVSTSKTQSESTGPVSAVPAQSFYGSHASPASKVSRTYAERKRTIPLPIASRSDHGTESDELDMLNNQADAQRESSEDLEVTESSRSIIFCLDSLGNSHPRALSRLNEYLQEEAKDKKGVENPSAALTKKALVPVQPNFCDCGLYLLHFAQTFMSDPAKYKSAIFEKKKTTPAERNVLWLNDQVPSMREGLKARILSESESWKKLKAEKEKTVDDKAGSGEGEASQVLQLEESDDEIEVSEVRRVGSGSASPKKQPRKSTATRLR